MVNRFQLENSRVTFLSPYSVTTAQTDVLTPANMLQRALATLAWFGLDCRFLARVSRGYEPGKARNVSLLDAMRYLTTSWDSVQSEKISSCFRKIGFRWQLASDDTERSEDDSVACVSDINDNIDVEFLCTGTDAPLAEFVSIGSNISTSEPQSVAKIVAEVVWCDTEKEAGDKALEGSGKNKGV